jgi:hypothetical protein
MKTSEIPSFVMPFLWSYDTAILDLSRDKALIIKNVLDYGTKEATDWLRNTYTPDDVRMVIENTPASAWGKKSLALWTLLYDVAPKHATRFA